MSTREERLARRNAVANMQFAEDGDFSEESQEDSEDVEEAERKISTASDTVVSGRAPELQRPVESEQLGRSPIPIEEEKAATVQVDKEREEPVAASNHDETAVESGGKPDAASREALLAGKGQGTRMTARKKAWSILFIENNPKRQGTKSHERYECYKHATTIGMALECGMTTADLKYDLSQGFAHYPQARQERPNAPPRQQHLEELINLKEQLRAMEQRNEANNQQIREMQIQLLKSQQERERLFWQMEREKDLGIRREAPPARRRLDFSDEEDKEDEPALQEEDVPTKKTKEVSKGKVTLSVRDIPKLQASRRNYQVWLLRVKQFFSTSSLQKGKFDLWNDVVNIDKSRVQSSNEIWMSLNQDACSYLTGALPDNLVCRVANKQFVCEWMNIIKPPSNFEVAMLTREQIQAKRKTDFKDVDEYVDAMETLYSEILACKEGSVVMDNNSYLITVIKGAQSDFRFKQTVRELYKDYEQRRGEFTIEDIRTALKTEEMRIKDQHNRRGGFANQAINDS